jgi:hypothetical protein
LVFAWVFFREYIKYTEELTTELGKTAVVKQTVEKEPKNYLK